MSLRFLTRLGFKILRTTSSEFRAYSDLFVPPYSTWMDWRTGVGPAAHVLYGLIRALMPETVVETGSARGFSTCAMALACRQNGRGRVFAIDPHAPNDWTQHGVQGSTEVFLRQRLAQYELQPWCEILRSTTKEIERTWQRKVDFLFIDGDHSLDGVRSDFEIFKPWFNPHALVAFHDSAWEHGKDWDSHDVAKVYPRLGVPEFLAHLQKSGLESITIHHLPGLTILDPTPGGFAFLSGRPDMAVTD